ncbi:hypothetical protein BKA69DRAFT_1037493 [Paraphysoderma sedebokerense]|nr:hypothetical protein BKA69DRAFT_1037493 [Paraphysoderma sedebokerense]
MLWISLSAILIVLQCASAQDIICPRIQPATDVPASYNLNTGFYNKYIPGPGPMKDIPIVSSGKVADEALYRAWYILKRMCETVDPRAWDKLAEHKIRVAVMARTEVTVDVPEHSDLTPADFWNSRSRGLGATESRPATSVGEENLLGLPRGDLPNDRYQGECILVHEFAHTVQQFGMRINPAFEAELRQIFERSTAKGLWNQTYAATNELEYWAEAVQSYFDCNQFSGVPDGIHNDITTRDKLRSYDPEMFNLINSVFKDNPWKYQVIPPETSICKKSDSTTSAPTGTSTVSPTNSPPSVTPTNGPNPNPNPNPSPSSSTYPNPPPTEISSSSLPLERSFGTLFTVIVSLLMMLYN